MKVMKFGGGCLNDAGDLHRAAALAACPPVVIVVSAMAGVTDALDLIVKTVATRGRFPAGLFQGLRNRHFDCLENISAATHDRFKSDLENQFNRLEEILRGIACIGEAPPSIQARILGFGERLASILLAGALTARGPAAVPCDAHQCGITADRPGTEARIDLPETRRRLRRNLKPILRSGRIPVVTGFFGRAPDGSTATFGRNASDYSAAAIACVLEAAELVIWKGVDGVMTMDPAYGGAPRPVESMTWEEVEELTHFGAGILHPLTLEPLQNSRARVRIRSFRHPERPGTEIVPTIESPGERLCGVTCHPSATMMQLSVAPGNGQRVLARLEEVLSSAAARVTSLTSARDRITLVMPSEDARSARRALNRSGNSLFRIVRTRDNHALVAVVGQAVRGPRGLARIMDALAVAGVTIEAIAPGITAPSLCLVVPGHQAGHCLRTIHKQFFPTAASRPRETSTGDQP